MSGYEKYLLFLACVICTLLVAALVISLAGLLVTTPW